MDLNLSTDKEALCLLMERFPSLALMASSWDGEAICDEKGPFIDPGKAEVLYCYGLSTTVYFQYQKFLEKNKRLIFLEDDPAVISSFLKRAEAVEILSDPRTFIEWISNEEWGIESLVQKYPVQRVEVISTPSKKKKFRALKLQILRSSTLVFAQHMDREHGYQPFSNFVINSKHLSSSFYPNAMKGAFKNIPAIVCGAGPSLKSSIPVLRNLEDKALLIAGGSTLAALSSQGITPHFGMAIDPNLEEYRRLKNSFAFEVPLLYSTRVAPDIFQTCNGPFGYMRSGIGGILELWLEEELALVDPLIGENLSSESISVTSICVAWAQFLGCNPILLNGIDMAYTENQRYAKGVVGEEKVGFKEIDGEKSAADRILRRKDRKGNFVHTAVRWVMESASISHFAKMHPEVQFINTTEGGIGFKGIKYSSLEVVSNEFIRRDIRSLVHEMISNSPMPKEVNKVVITKMGDLISSLEKVIEYLLILTDNVKGSKALAELEIYEEMATSYLFYDVNQIFPDDLWVNWLKLARKYLLFGRG